jgi:hypothetical protein
MNEILIPNHFFKKDILHGIDFDTDEEEMGLNKVSLTNEQLFNKFFKYHIFKEEFNFKKSENKLEISRILKNS